MKIAFIGLGKMGSGMARNLLRAGYELTVYNRTPEKARAIVGARVAETPAAACRAAGWECDAVVTMLADDAAVEAVMHGEHGIASALPENSVHISSSTISTALARRLAAEHATRGQGYLSAPVFGRPEAAEQKRLIAVAAGPAGLIDRFRPVFDAIGRQTFVVGAEPWQANAVKVCGNFMIVSVIEAFSESFATLRKAGVDPHTFLDVMNVLFGSPVYESYGKTIADEKFEPAGFALKLGLKDIRLVLAAAEECTAPMPMASLLRDRFLSAVAQGQAEMDWSSIARLAARDAGL